MLDSTGCLNDNLDNMLVGLWGRAFYVKKQNRGFLAFFAKLLIVNIMSKTALNEGRQGDC